MIILCVISFKGYAFPKLAKYLVETTFTLHVCMNMIKTCWNLTIVNLKSQHKTCYLLMSRVKLFYLSLLYICFISLNFSHVSYSLAKD